MKPGTREAGAERTRSFRHEEEWQSKYAHPSHMYTMFGLFWFMMVIIDCP